MPSRRKYSRKSSRKTSRRGSRKTYRRGSRKTSRRGSRKVSKRVYRSKSPRCNTLESAACLESMDRKGMRRCRVNINTRKCENLPMKYRERATLQVGGSATVTPYKAMPGKLSAERLKMFQQ